MSQGSRPKRVGDLVRGELSILLTRHVRDPGLRAITVTRVQMSPDLQLARVYYTGPEEERDRRDTARALKRARPYLRRQLGQRLQLRRVPELAFHYDDSAERQSRIARLFDEIAADRRQDSDI